MNKKELIEKITEKIKNHYKPEKIILFGAFAWGKPLKESDIDLLIIKRTKYKFRQRAIKVKRILREENALAAIDILVYNPEEISERLKLGDSSISKILRKGKVLFCKFKFMEET